MAAQMKLVLFNQTTEADVSYLDLLDYNDNFEIIDNGYTPSEIKRGQTQTKDTITFQIKAASHDLLAAAIQDFEAQIRNVYYGADVVEKYVVVFRVQTAHETNPRQAYVFDLEGSPASAFAGTQLDYPATDGEYFIERYILTVTHGYWEALASVDYGSASSIAEIGGTVNLSALSVHSIKGDVGARVSSLIFTDTYTKVWVGLKDARSGVDPTKFVPVWHLHLGTLTNSTATGSDSSASDGTKVITSFTSTDIMRDRVFISTDNVAGADFEHQRGRYQVLLRAQESGGGTGTINVRLAYGSSNPMAYVTLNRVKIRDIGSQWHYYELGEADLPAMRGLASTNKNSGFTIQAECTEITGTLNVDMDCLVLIPTLNGGLGFSHTIWAASTDQNIYSSLIDGHDIAYTLNQAGGANLMIDRLAISPKDFTLKPTSSGVFVMAAEKSLVSGKGSGLAFSLKCVPRWRNLRGAA